MDTEPVAIPIHVETSEPVLVGGLARPRVARLAGASAAIVEAPHRSGRRAPETRPTPPIDVATRTRGAPGPAHRVAERIGRRAQAVFGLRHTLVAPLTTGAGQIGALVISRRTAGGWPESAERILNGAAIEASAALARAYSHRQAEARAATDGLTGLPNRRYFDEFCALLARRRRAEDSVGVLMIDIDRFKALNDAHGHLVGDDVLRAVGGAIAATVREDDVPARYGGEEFVVLLRNPTLDVAVEVGERVREAVGRLDLRALGVPAVSVSVGVAVADGPDEPIAEIIGNADRGLYLAKRRGRDQVVAA
jgi:diguanylate cyclase (GGDEF)-like protein